MSTTVHIAIGNSDDRLTQQRWADFCTDVDWHISRLERAGGIDVHGRWHSAPAAGHQNACWAFSWLGEPTKTTQVALRVSLRLVADIYDQDSIAWNESETEFLQGREPTTEEKP